MPTKISEVPSKEFLNGLFYEKDGFIYWNARTMSRGRPSLMADNKVNTFEQDGYFRVVIKGAKYILARIVYQMHYGDLTPAYEVDHIDRNRSNNVVANLRKVESTTNKRNKRKQKNTVTDNMGVTFCRKFHPAPYEYQFSDYWVARWCDLGGKICSKNFNIAKLGGDEAYSQAVAYRNRMIENLNEQGAGYTCNHGK